MSERKDFKVIYEDGTVETLVLVDKIEGDTFKYLYFYLGSKPFLVDSLDYLDIGDLVTMDGRYKYRVIKIDRNNGELTIEVAHDTNIVPFPYDKLFEKMER